MRWVLQSKLGLHGKRRNNSDMTNFGKGLVLVQSNPWLQDEMERIERILDVTERNSIIEGLPPLSKETRERLRRELTAGSEPVQAPLV
jgi:hypothetical protein